MYNEWKTICDEMAELLSCWQWDLLGSIWELDPDIIPHLDPPPTSPPPPHPDLFPPRPRPSLEAEFMNVQFTKLL